MDEPGGRPSRRSSNRTTAVSRSTFTQSDPRGRSLLWNQRLQVALGYEYGARITAAEHGRRSIEIPRVADLPFRAMFSPNGEGIGYGLFSSTTEPAVFSEHICRRLAMALTRATAGSLCGTTCSKEAPPRSCSILRCARCRSRQRNRTSSGFSRTRTTRSGASSRGRPRGVCAAALEQSLRAGSNAPRPIAESGVLLAFRRTASRRDAARVSRAGLAAAGARSPGSRSRKPTTSPMAQELARARRAGPTRSCRPAGRASRIPIARRALRS